jgi:hypothetical protein
MGGGRRRVGGVVNRPYFELLLIEVEELESVSFKVLFWHVGRVFNQDAERLANLALDG